MYKLPKSFCPKFKTQLIRLGQSNDGGYNIPQKMLEEAKILFSFGLDEDWSFENDLAYVYLFFATETDGVLDESEIGQIK